jgi:hypothetical protein
MESLAFSPRRRVQFRLRTLMIVVTLLTVSCASIWGNPLIGFHRATP